MPTLSLRTSTSLSFLTPRFKLKPIQKQEHSYYLDYQNVRAKYVEAVLGDGKDPATGIIDWGEFFSGFFLLLLSFSTQKNSLSPFSSLSFSLKITFHRPGPEKPRGH